MHCEEFLIILDTYTLILYDSLEITTTTPRRIDTNEHHRHPLGALLGARILCRSRSIVSLRIISLEADPATLNWLAGLPR
jgi:hypothetical protein